MGWGDPGSGEEAAVQSGRIETREDATNPFTFSHSPFSDDSPARAGLLMRRLLLPVVDCRHIRDEHSSSFRCSNREQMALPRECGRLPQLACSWPMVESCGVGANWQDRSDGRRGGWTSRYRCLHDYEVSPTVALCTQLFAC